MGSSPGSGSGTAGRPGPHRSGRQPGCLAAAEGYRIARHELSIFRKIRWRSRVTPRGDKPPAATRDGRTAVARRVDSPLDETSRTRTGGTMAVEISGTYS